MYLFRTNEENQIEVYELLPRPEEIKAYKRSELDKIEPSKRFMKHVTVRNGRELSSPCGLEVCPHFDKNKPIEGLNYSDMFIHEGSNHYKNRLRENYIAGDLSFYMNPVFYQIIGIDNKKKHTGSLYMLATEPYVQAYKNSEMRNILVLPKSLYILHLLEAGKLELLKGENCAEQLELFDINFVQTIDWNNVADLVKFGLLNDAVDRAHEVVDASEEVIALKKKNPRA